MNDKELILSFEWKKMRFIKIESKDWSLLMILDMEVLYWRRIFKKIYKEIRKVNEDTYRFIY